MTFDVDLARLKCGACGRYDPTTRARWCDGCRAERAQANVDRRKAERRMEKERLGIKDPTLKGWWTRHPLCVRDPKQWSVAVVGRIGEVGELRDVAVERADKTTAHCRNYMIVGYGESVRKEVPGAHDPTTNPWVVHKVTFLRSVKDLPADRPDLRIAAFGNLGPGGIER